MIEIYNKTAIQWIIIINTIVFIGSLALNYFGMKLSLWGPVHSISAISDKYFTMITPAKYTFSIWGIIYTLGTVVMVSFWKLAVNNNVELFNEISTLIFIFMIIAIINPLWIVAWTREKILLSWLIMVSILTLLIIASKLSSQLDNSYAPLLKAFFNIYMGWISVAFSINTATLITTYGVTPISITSMKISSVVIIVLTLISLFILFYYNNLAFTFVILWALLGIYFQKDPRVIEYQTLKNVVLACVLVVGSSLGYALFNLIKNIPPK